MKVTQEMRQAVYADECERQGHTSFDVVYVYGTHDPQSLICRRCGKSWAVQQ